MAVEWAKYRIRVNALCPGFMLTPLSKPLWDDPQKGKWILERSLLRRPGFLRNCGLSVAARVECRVIYHRTNMYVEGGWLAGTPWSNLEATHTASVPRTALRSP